MADNSNFQEIMQKAQEMQNKMKWMQKKLISQEIVGESGGGMVQITVNGKHEVIKVLLFVKSLTQPEFRGKKYLPIL